MNSLLYEYQFKTSKKLPSISNNIDDKIVEL